MKKYLIIFFFFLAYFCSSNGQQISSSCTALLLKSFTPCLNYFTGSSDGSSSPSSGCCESLGSLIGSGTQCACLAITGNVPLNVPINRTLAISLPRLCKETSVPLQCNNTDAGSPIPSPGPVDDSPGLPPLSQTYQPPAGIEDNPPPPRVPSYQSPPAAPSRPSISNTPPNQGSSQSLPPLILPSSALKISTAHSYIIVLLLLPIIYLF